MKETTTVTNESGGKRLDVWLAEAAEISRSRAQQLIESGEVLLNGKTAKKRDSVSPGDEVTYEIPEPEEIEAVPQDLPINIVYEDDHLLVVDKPQGMVVHPAPGNPDGTLVNALLYHCKGRLSSINGMVRPGIVHRIDKDTSGLLIVAKTDEAHRGLAEQIAVHSFVRRYEAVCVGSFREESGTVDAPIGRSKTDRKKMAVTRENSKPAVTHYRVLGETKNKMYSHLELTLETGRTHQIRVHMAYMGHPVAGDPVYGTEKHRLGLSGQCLFAKFIQFTHPVSGAVLAFEADRPQFLKETLEKLGIGG
ncbi:MAG: RluA family pseudouridine synthase [Clostridia bacterium]|jgi:23S rRNA pseudouridine1911/1915/1917 synthase|nr:RluA family pseudouridine synthase [Clostridia bacterium]